MLNMAFQTIDCDLGDGFVITAKQEKNTFHIAIKHKDQEVGQAILVTDFVDTECITSIQLNEAHASHTFANGYSLAEAVVKFLIKFPSMVRKPEFRFVLEAPEFLKFFIKNYHFNEKDEESLYVRNEVFLPQSHTKLDGLVLTTEAKEEALPALLALLKNNAYWQSHLTLERLRLLVSSSQCVLAFKEGELLGFARVVSDKTTFASLWDVVVAVDQRGQGIGKAMMVEIFSNPTYATLKHWFLFTDTAAGLYSQFGFVKETLVADKTPMHKLRLQSEHPLYMDETIRYSEFSPKHLALSPKQSQAYLFETKRAQLTLFWQDNEKTNQLVKSYLAHLKLVRQQPSLEYLQTLQKTHIETIPHENINATYNIPASFEIEHLLKKYTKENRGGMCFELNYSFGWLLHHLGFDVELKLSWVNAYNDAKENNPYPTHPVIIVFLNGQQFLTDVGWSDSYSQPLVLSDEVYQDVGGTGVYHVVPKDNHHYVMQKQFASKETGQQEWVDQFTFAKPQAPLKQYNYPLGFLPAYSFTCVGPEYLFMNLFKFTQVTDQGNKTVSSDRFFTRQGERKSANILPNEVPLVLQEHSNISPNIAWKCTIS